MSTTPYTRAEQEEFRPLLKKKLTQARSDLELLRKVLTEEQDTTEHGGQSEGEVTLSKADTELLLKRQEKFIATLEEAVKRIDNGVYGMCRVTGHRISRERLRLLPQVTLSIAAKCLPNADGR